MSEILEYAGAETLVPAPRWPLVVVAVLTVVAAMALLVQHCAFGMQHVSDAGRSWREEAWGRVLGSGASCLLMLAGGLWFARRARMGEAVARRVLWVGVAAWLGSCAIMAIRVAW